MVLNLKIEKFKKKSRYHGTGQTAEWNDLKTTSILETGAD